MNKLVIVIYENQKALAKEAHKINEETIKSIIPDFKWKLHGNAALWYEDEDFYIVRSEWADVEIRGKKSGNKIRFNEVTELLSHAEMSSLNCV